MKLIEYHDSVDSVSTKTMHVVHLNYEDIIANADINTKWVWIYDGLHSVAASLDILKEIVDVQRSKNKSE